MTNLQIEIDYEGNKEAAESHGWSVPSRPVSDDEAAGWLSYWDEMMLHDEKVAAGDKDPGRPVVPHISAITRGKCSDCKSIVRIDKEKRDKFEQLSRPLIKFLNDYTHPHARIIISTDSAELVEGLAVFTTTEYIPN